MYALAVQMFSKLKQPSELTLFKSFLQTRNFTPPREPEGITKIVLVVWKLFQLLDLPARFTLLVANETYVVLNKTLARVTSYERARGG